MTSARAKMLRFGKDDAGRKTVTIKSETLTVHNFDRTRAELAAIWRVPQECVRFEETVGGAVVAYADAK